MSEQQAQPLRTLKIEITPAIIDKERWNPFCDAPLNFPRHLPAALYPYPWSTARYRATPLATLAAASTTLARPN